MLTRRQLLTRGSTLLVLVPVLPALIQGCSSGSSSDHQGGGSCAGTDPLSTVNAGHTHTVCVPNSDMTSPPAAGATYTSSNDGNHTHTIALTAQQLSTISSGGSVTVTSSSDVDPVNGEAHTHNWTIIKMAPSNPPPSGW